MLGGEKGSVAFHGDHRPAKVATHRESRNLLDTFTYKLGADRSPGWYTSGAYRINVVTKNNDGSLTLPSGYSGTVYVGIECLLEAGTYTASYAGDDGYESAYVQIGSMNDYSHKFNSDKSRTFTASDDNYYVRLLLVCDASEFAGKTVRFMLNEGTEAKPYEPYGTIEQVISEPAESTQEGTALTFDRTYNHVAEVSVFGKSTQDGTPTPDAPVPIESIKSVELVSRNADGSKSATRTIDLQGHELRSLPYGTMDELVVHRDGMVELVQRVERERMYSSYTNGVEQQAGEGYIVYSKEYDTPSANWGNGGRCTHFTNGNGVKGDASYRIGAGNNWVYIYTTDQDVISNPSVWFASHEVYFDYPLATPQTIQLPSIDPLPTFHPHTFIDGNGADISVSVKVMPS